MIGLGVYFFPLLITFHAVLGGALQGLPGKSCRPLSAGDEHPSFLFPGQRVSEDPDSRPREAVQPQQLQGPAGVLVALFSATPLHCGVPMDNVGTW